MMFKNKIYSLFIPNKGCRNKCIYCNQFFATGHSDTNSDFISQLENFKKKSKNITEIGLYGGNFTALKLTEQKNILDLINNITNKKISIRISTRPDYLTDENIKMLYEENVRTIELGLQTSSEKILKILGRNYSMKQVIESNKKLNKYNFNISYHLMLGLPNETKQDFFNSVDFVISLKPDYVRLHPTVVIKDTKLHKMYISKEFIPLDFDESVKLSAYAYKKFSNNNIKVIKLGLHSEASLSNNIVAGPYHPSYAQFVKSVIILDKIKKIFKNREIKFIIKSNDYNNNIIRGYKNTNLNNLKQLGLENIIIDNSIRNSIIKLITTNKEYCINIY
jgi:histone acetyltransferase (RNA polymerase elongator complex component)